MALYEIQTDKLSPVTANAMRMEKALKGPIQTLKL